ncbi:MAG TPA: BON domain-containing protein [Rhodoferax sp.]|nr:BON domain-containing protein [Rhodoferax sp.]
MIFACKKLLGLILVSVTLGASLSACFPVIVGGAMLGTMMAIDRRTAGAQVDDERIELSGASLIRTHMGDRVHVNLVSYNRRVLLTGEVPSQQDSQRVEQLVSGVENVQAVVNELAVLGSTSLTQRSSDALITGRVKAALLDAKDLYVSAFKVVTERGTVYLMGRVTEREAGRATEIARSTPGVQKVVRVFEIISEDELRALLPKPSAAEAAATK